MSDEIPMDETTTAAAPKNGRRQSGRSPAYPAIDLGRAVARARVIWDMEKQYSMSPETVMKHWNYTSLNGPAGLQLSALVKFGLMDDQGTKKDRRVKLTDLAVTILNHPVEAERQRAIRTAALIPQVHRDMWEDYGLDLPSDENLMWSLTRERGFTESGAREFIKEYRATIAYARMDESAGDEQDDTGPENDTTPASIAEAPLPATGVWVQRAEVPARMPAPAVSAERWGNPVAAGYRVGTGRPAQPQQARSVYPRFPIPLPGGRGVVTVEGPFPITQDEWSHLLLVLGAMKPGFVKDPTPHPQPSLGESGDSD